MHDDGRRKAGRGQGPRKGVRVGRTRMGKAVFAQQQFFSEELIGEIEGKIIDDGEYSSDYCMDLGDDRCLEPAAPFRYLNHSCEPNCSFDWFDVNKQGRPGLRRRVFLTAIEDIQPGDELTIDYRWPADMAIPCTCHMPGCRGWIVDIEELPELLAGRAPDRSADHWSG